MTQVVKFEVGKCPSCHHDQHVGKACVYVVAGSATHPLEVCECPPERAIKASAGKVKGFSLFPWEIFGELLGIWQYGIKKGYLKDSWRNVAPEEYVDALGRHYTAMLRGEARDPESGERHIAHAAWNAITLMVLLPK